MFIRLDIRNLSKSRPSEYIYINQKLTRKLTKNICIGFLGEFLGIALSQLVLFCHSELRNMSPNTLNVRVCSLIRCILFIFIFSSKLFGFDQTARGSQNKVLQSNALSRNFLFNPSFEHTVCTVYSIQYVMLLFWKTEQDLNPLSL